MKAVVGDDLLDSRGLPVLQPRVAKLDYRRDRGDGAGDLGATVWGAARGGNPSRIVKPNSASTPRVKKSRAEISAGESTRVGAKMRAANGPEAPTSACDSFDAHPIL